MKLHVLALGKLKEHALRAVAEDYSRRIQRYASLRQLEFKDGAEADGQARLSKALPGRGQVVALEVDGRSLDSHELARWVGQCEQTAVSDVTFLIGGAYGLPAEISRAATMRLSLSRMTLPHRLARVVLLEQVYRAFTILRGEPYSH